MLEISKKRNSVYTMMALLLITKILGFLKLRIIAQLFGVSHELDIFWAAFTIPDTLFMIIVAGSLNAAIIPILSDIFYKKGEEQLNRFFNNLIMAVGFLITAMALILFIFTPQITNFLITSDTLRGVLNFSSRITPDDFSLFVKLTRIMMLSPVLLGISTIVTGYLQVRRQFFITSLAPLMYNLAMVIGPVIAVKLLGAGVTGIAVSAVVGSFLHFVIQVPSLRRYFTEKVVLSCHSLKLALQDSQIWKGLKLAVPRMIAILGEQVNVIVNTLISFSLAAGALSAYKFALSLYLFPVNIVGGAIAQVALPELAEKCDKEKEYKTAFNKFVQQALYLIFPLVSILLILRLPLVRLVYGVGEFDWRATILTSWSLVLLSLAVIGQTLSQIVLRGFYAIKETWLPLIAVIVGIVANVVLAYYLTNFFSHYYDWRPIILQIGTQVSTANGSGLLSIIKSFFSDFVRWCTTRGTSDMAVGGLSLSLSLASIVEVVILLYLLNRRRAVVTWKETIYPILIKLVNAGLMAFGMYLVFKLFDFKLDTTRTVSIVVLTILTSGYGLLSYWLGSKVFEIKEVEFFEEKALHLLSKFSKKLKNEGI